MDDNRLEKKGYYVDEDGCVWESEKAREKYYKKLGKEVPSKKFVDENGKYWESEELYRTCTQPQNQEARVR